MRKECRTFEEFWKLFELAQPKPGFRKIERTIAEVFWNGRDAEVAALTQTIARLEGMLTLANAAKDLSYQELARKEEYAASLETKITSFTPRGSPMEMAQDLKDARIAMFEKNIELATEAERRDCSKALLAMAGKIPTPLEGYGCNTSWAISDLCKCVALLAPK